MKTNDFDYYPIVVPTLEDTVFGNQGDEVKANVSYTFQAIKTLIGGGTVPTKTSELENDGDGTSPFVTEDNIPAGDLQATLEAGNSAIFEDEDGTITEINIGGEAENRYISISIINESGEQVENSLIYIKKNQAYLQSIIGLNNGFCGLSEDGLPKIEVSYNDPESPEGFVRLTTESPISEKAVTVKVQSDKPTGTYYIQPESNKSLVYKALLSQEGTGNPTAIVFSTDFPAPIVWTRVYVGIYRGTLTGAFGIERTFVPTVQITGQGNSTLVDKTNANYIEVSTFDFENASSDDLLSYTEIQIQVYNIT